MDIGTLASIIAAITGIIMLFHTIYHSKGNIRKRIERKKRKIYELENQFTKKYGIDANMSQHYPTQRKIEELKKEIIELEKEL